MNIHKNARLTPHGRERAGSAGAERADAAGRRTSRRRLPAHGAQVGRALRGRRRGGPAGSHLAAASAAPADAAGDRRADRSLRRQRLTGKQIAAEAGVSPATVSRILKRLGPQHASRAGAGRAGPPLRARAARRADPHRHQEARPLRPRRPPHHRRPHRPEQRPRRRLGVRPCLHRRRLAHRLPQILPDEKKESAVAFLKAAVAYYASLGVTVARVMTDNGSCYTLERLPRGLPRSRPQAHPDQALHARRPTARPSASSRPPARMGLRPRLPDLRRRAHELPFWLHRYNWHRPHGSIKSKPPISRLALDRGQPVEARNRGSERRPARLIDREGASQ